jgi:hypothetical protein
MDALNVARRACVRILVLDEYPQQKFEISISRLFHAGDAIMAPDTPMDETLDIYD